MINISYSTFDPTTSWLSSALTTSRPRLLAYITNFVFISFQPNAPLQSSVSTTAINNSSSNTLPRSRIPSPTKPGMSGSKKNSSSSIPSTPKKLSCEESPSKSRIPVLRSSSYRVPKTISFGFGVPKVFPMHSKKTSDPGGKHWHQVHKKSTKNDVNVATPIENPNFDDMRMALD